MRDDALLQASGCCDRHAGWPQLYEELRASFPEIPFEEIISELAAARVAAVRFGLSECDQLEVAGQIVRNRMLLQQGDAPLARLDPQIHLGGRALPVEG